MAQPPQACAPCPAHYAVLQGAYARYTNTLIVLERALYLANANKRTLLVDTQAMFPNNSKITQKYNPGTRSLADILQVEPFRAACICIDDVSTVPDVYRSVRSPPGTPGSSGVSWYGTQTPLSKFEHDTARIAVLASGDLLFKHACTPGDFSRAFHRAFRFPECVEQLASAYATSHFKGEPFIGLHLRADPSPTKQYDLKCFGKAPCDPSSAECPAEAFAAASNGCNMTTENVRGAATTLWGARGATAGEFVAAPPDLWMQKSSEARRLIGDHRTHFMPLMVVNATGWYELMRGGKREPKAAGAEAVPPRRRTRLQRIELPEACRVRAYPVDALQLDQALLARSDLFFGNWVSTFSSFVAKLRAARGLPLESSVLYWPPLPGAPRGVPPPGASFWATCNSAAAHKRCVVSESGKRASVALAYNKPECSGL